MGREWKYHAHLTSGAASNKDLYFEKGIKQQSLINIQGWTLDLDCSNKKVKKVKKLNVSDFSKMFYFTTCHALNT